jgi:anti-sigma B factor antagonist
MAELDTNHAAELVVATRLDATGAPVVTVSGELDISTAADLEASIAQITAEHPDRLVFDLRELRFMDSAGIAVLISAAAKANTVRLRHPSPIIRRVVEISGLCDVLPIES